MSLAEKFFNTFAGLMRAHGTYAIPAKQNGGKKKVEGRAVTLKAEVTVEKWEQHLAGKTGIGIVPIMDDANVNWAAIDVDDYDLDHIELENKCEKLKLPIVLCTTKSGGAHLYVFFKEPVTAKLARSKLMEWVIALGCKPGTEIFPKQVSLANESDVGNWINMPYFDAEQTKRFAIYKGKKLSAAKFIEYAAVKAVSLDDFANINVDLAGGAFSDGPPCLQALAASGFPQGTRNMGLFNLGVYCRHKHGDDWQQHLEEMNRDYMQPPLASGEVSQAIRSLSKKTYFYTCDKQPVVQCCNKEICKQREFGVGGGGEDVPVTIGSLTRINSEIPTFFIDVEGHRIEVTPEELLMQERFRLLCLTKISKLPTRMKQNEWEKIVRDRLENQEVIDAPPDAGPTGQFYMHLDAFCAGRHKAKAIDEILLGKPFADPESKRTYFRSTDLIKYLDQQHFREFKDKKIWALIRERGGEHGSRTLKGKFTNYWSIPTPAEQTEPFDKGVF
jgi:hypothetical protein